MSIKKRGLGRGLDAMLSGSVAPAAKGQAKEELRHLPVDIIQRGQYQPRKEMQAEALQELAASISQQGVIQPIVVRQLSPGRYEIIAGERRWRAAQLAGLTDIPALIRDVPDEAAIAMALIENIQRENLNPLEEAVALQRLCDELTLTHQQVAETVGKSRAAVTNMLRLLTLHPEVKSLLEQSHLDMGHARALLALQGAVQVQAAQMTVAKGLSVRETEKLVNRLLNPQESETVKSSASADVRRFERDLSDKLGAVVSVRHSAKGKGRLVIQYNNLDELEGILAHIR